jgi:hypothetical protein
MLNILYILNIEAEANAFAAFSTAKEEVSAAFVAVSAAK